MHREDYASPGFARVSTALGGSNAKTCRSGVVQEIQQSWNEYRQVMGSDDHIQVIRNFDAAQQQERWFALPIFGRKKRGNTRQLPILPRNDDCQMGIRPFPPAACLPPGLQVFVTQERYVVELSVRSPFHSPARGSSSVKLRCRVNSIPRFYQYNVGVTVAFDLNMFPFYRIKGQEWPTLPGLQAMEPPRRTARGRENDRLVIYLTFSGNDPFSSSEYNQTAAQMAKQFYQTAGSVTSAVRSVAESINQLLVDRNLRTTGKGQYIIGRMILGVLRGSANGVCPVRSNAYFPPDWQGYQPCP